MPSLQFFDRTKLEIIIRPNRKQNNIIGVLCTCFLEPKVQVTEEIPSFKFSLAKMVIVKQLRRNINNR